MCFAADELHGKFSRHVSWLACLGHGQRLDASTLKPFRHCLGREFGAIITANEVRSATNRKQASQYFHYILASNAFARINRQILSGELIEHHKQLDQTLASISLGSAVHCASGENHLPITYSYCRLSSHNHWTGFLGGYISDARPLLASDECNLDFSNAVKQVA